MRGCPEPTEEEQSGAAAADEIGADKQRVLEFSIETESLDVNLSLEADKRAYDAPMVPEPRLSASGELNKTHPPIRLVPDASPCSLRIAYQAYPHTTQAATLPAAI